MELIGKGVSALAVTVMIGGLSLAHPAFAADDTTGTNQTQVDQTQSGVAVHKGMHRVDARINELHKKLRKFTASQENKWKPVARIMRQNENAIHRLVQARNDKENMNAVEDLRSYEKIAVAHEQGLKKLVPAFDSFYNSLTPEQKRTADNMFSNYEGREMDKTGNAGKFNNIQPSSGDVNTNENNMDDNGVNNGNNTPPNDTGTTTNPSDQPANQDETK